METSVVSLIYDPDGLNVDIADHAIIEAAAFHSASTATPGDCSIVVRDVDRDMAFITGKRLQLFIDGQQMWSGFLLIVDRGSFFDAGDGLSSTTTITRNWVLHGSDNNILLDARVLRNTSNYLDAIPDLAVATLDGDILIYGLDNYVDTPAWLDISTLIENVTAPSGGAAYKWPQQGSKLRDLFEDLARFSAAVYYIGPDDAVHYAAIQDVECPWGFSDVPNNLPLVDVGGYAGAFVANGGPTTGFRELNAEEDGQQLTTDALVWGGGELSGTVFFRSTDPALELVHGKWQIAETWFGNDNYRSLASVTERANVIVFGNEDGDPSRPAGGTVSGEGPSGLRFSQWQYAFTWGTRNVPVFGGVPRHIYPGDVVPIELWAFSEDAGVTPFTRFLPLRTLEITFPSGAASGEAYVQFRGTFDLRNEDNTFLWKFLRTREAQIIAAGVTATPVNGSSTEAPQGGFGDFSTDETDPGVAPPPDGVTTVFHTQILSGNVGYIPATTQLFADTGAGLTLRQRGTFYTESDPDTGEITLASATGVTAIHIIDRTQAA